MTDQIVDAVARALCEANGRTPVKATVKRYNKFAQAAVDAHLKALHDAGFKVIPPAPAAPPTRSLAWLPAGGPIVKIPRYGPGRIE